MSRRELIYNLAVCASMIAALVTFIILLKFMGTPCPKCKHTIKHCTPIQYEKLVQ